MALAHGILPHLLPTGLVHVISGWLKEDCPTFDYGGFVVGTKDVEAKLLGKTAGVLAGLPFFEEVFRQLNCTCVSYSSFRPTRISSF